MPDPTRPVIPSSPGPDRPVTTTAEMPSPRQVDFGNDWAYDGCADCIVGEPHICTSYERKRPRRHYEEADCAGGW